MSNFLGVLEVSLTILGVVILTASGLCAQADCSGIQPQGGSNRTPSSNLYDRAGNVQGAGRAKVSPGNGSNFSTGLQAKVSDSQPSHHTVFLSWNPSTSPNVVGYNIYRWVSSGARQPLNSALIPSTSCVDSSVQNGQTYYYVATAVNSKGKESADSNLAVAPIPPLGGSESASGKRPIQ